MSANVLISHPTQAARHIAGKPPLSYVHLPSFAPMAYVLEFGAQKYERDNWQKGSPVTQLLDCLMRHIAELQDGKDIDEESGQLIVGHIQANAMFIGHTVLNHPELDDRVKIKKGNTDAS